MDKEHTSRWLGSLIADPEEGGDYRIVFHEVDPAAQVSWTIRRCVPGQGLVVSWQAPMNRHHSSRSGWLRTAQAPACISTTPICGRPLPEPGMRQAGRFIWSSWPRVWPMVQEQ
ncbi:hypothetical protein FM114_11455 [Luteococcus japonicus LSP_Lj1]|uniref:Uncharacterized protein n=1 Tax=Luteococcus japonicus LSP_Lj1 TaxID=1255658 RepID=A0A1R4K4Y4_9ACTN|nr:hypothetical protein [Luteococcus japonicus]SJN39298.1 hypothetical protein FM114_11455 [Luteococcus japonicus LSP_Lj1]